MKNKNITGAAVRMYRERLEMSQGQLAAKAQRAGWDIARDAVAKIEGGVRCVTDIELMALAGILEVAPSDLLPAGVKKVKRP